MNTLEKKESIYIGKSIPIAKDKMEKYAQTILLVSKKVSKNMGYQYQVKDISELESLATSIIIEKCGGIVYNMETNTEIMERCIYNKCKKHIIGTIFLEKSKNNIIVLTK